MVRVKREQAIAEREGFRSEPMVATDRSFLSCCYRKAKTRSHTRPPFFSSLGWTIMESPEIRVTITIVVSFSSSMSWTICPSTSAEPISCSRCRRPS